ncbi:MAG: right-handed parallel beta-helix repeat-containing protein [Planctomycetia bacterium]|nr:right-handed parallel beta-helix repeat-containing protein [Planctomycetia bacterium]
MKNHFLFAVFVLTTCFLFGGEPALVPTLRNANFQDFDSSRNVPSGWNGDGWSRCEPIPGGVRVTITQTHANHASLGQTLKITNGPQVLKLYGTVSSAVFRAGYLQVKLFRNGTEIRRISTDANRKTGLPVPMALRFSTDDADTIQVLCRVSTDRGVGTAVVFSGLKLETVPPGTLDAWTFASGKGTIQPHNAEHPAAGFDVRLNASESERFAISGKDFLISQTISLPEDDPDTTLEFAATMESRFVHFGRLRATLWRGGTRIGEFESPQNRWCRDVCRVVFPRNGADRVVLAFVFTGLPKYHGEEVACAAIFFGHKRPLFSDARPPQPELEVVPGFATASVYRHHCVAEKDGEMRCSLEYREANGSGDWHTALEPVYFPENRTLRGSLLRLNEATEYELRLTVSDAGKTETRTARFQTKSSDVPIWKTVELGPENRRFPWVPETGSREKGYVRYVSRPGFVLDAGETADCVVDLSDAEYVLLDGLTIRGGKIDGIRILNARHIRVRNCDIAGFSRVGEQRVDRDGKFYLPGDDRHALNNDCGIRIVGSDSILVERCFIHDPRGTANSWFYSHPAGPNAVLVGDSTGVCLRWNDFIGSDAHRWNDTVEGLGNGSNRGSVHRDAEIYGNYFAFGNDDGMELDGGQVNCRFFSNRVEGHLCGVSTAPCKLGPCYLYQNLFCNPGDVYGLVGVGFKNNFQLLGTGTTFFLSNTVIAHSTTFSSPGGSSREYAAMADLRPFKAFARNNLSQEASAMDPSFFTHLRSDFDGNLYSPRCEKELKKLQEQSPSIEKHAILADAVFRNAAGGDYRLAEDSPGKGAGMFVPNVTPWKSFDVGAVGIVPDRPVPLTTDVAHVDLRSDGTETEPDARGVTLTAKSVVAFQIVQPDAATFFKVTPSSGILQPGERVSLVVQACPDTITDARRNVSAFSIRTPDGLSRPVSVTVDSRDHTALVEKVRRNVVYGAVRPLENGQVELEFQVPRDGKYWLFAAGKAADCQWNTLRLDGGKEEKRIPLSARGISENGWRNVASEVFSGTPNRPFSLQAGRHVFRLIPRSASRPLLLTDAALCENPDAFRLHSRK